MSKDRKHRVAALCSAIIALIGLTVPAGTAVSAANAPSSTPATCPTTSPEPIATIDLSKDGLGDIAVNPVTNRIYDDVPQRKGSRVFVLDGRTNRTIASIVLHTAAEFVSVDDRTDQIYASGGDTISVIDGRANRVTRTIHVEGTEIHAVVDPVNGLVYAAGEFSNSVAVVNARTGKVIANIPVGAGPVALTIDARTHRVYVGNDNNGSDNSVSVINELTNKVVATIPVPHFISSIAVDTWTNLVYVGGDLWTIIDGRTNAVTASFSAGEPGVLAVDPNIDTIFNGEDDDIFYGLCGHTDTITTSNDLTGERSELSAIAIDTATQRVYVADTFYGKISVFDYSGDAQ